MAALFFFDAMVPAPRHEVPAGSRDPRRQVEVFAHGQQLHLRVGPVGEENSADNRYSVTLELPQARELLEGLNSGIAYFGG